MKEIRLAFHEVTNLLNNITIQVGTTKEIAKLKDIDTMSEKELKEEFKKALELLSLVENFALEAGKTTNELRKKVYGLLKIDTSKPVE